MPVRLWCPDQGRAFTQQDFTWEQLSGRDIRCPVCGKEHAAEEAPPEPPPAGAPAAERPTYRLFPVSGLVLAGFLGSFLGTGIALAVNLRRLGRSRGAIQAVVLGAIATVATIYAAFHLPDKFPAVAVWGPALLVVWVIAKGIMEQPWAEFLAAGGTPASNGWAALIGGICLVVILLPVLGWTVFSPAFPGEKLTVGKDEVFYSGEATKADAERLAGALKENGLFGGKGVTVHVEKAGGSWTFDFVVTDGAWDWAKVISGFTDIGKALALQGFGLNPTIRLCDNTGKVRRTL